MSKVARTSTKPAGALCGLLAAIGAVSASFTPASATILQSPLFFGVVSGQPPLQSSVLPSGPLANQGESGANQFSAGVDYSATPTPSVSATAGAIGIQFSSDLASASGFVQYSFTVIGPATTGPILVDLAFNGSVEVNTPHFQDNLVRVPPTGTTFATAKVQWSSTSFPTQQLAAFTCTAGYSNQALPSGNFCDNFSGTFSESIQVGSLNEVTITAEAQSGGGVGPDGSPVPAGGSAFIDPLITIDPSVPNPNQFSIEVSPGIGNSAPVAAVDEPSTIAIFAVGIGALFLTGRRRKGRRVATVGS